MFEEDKRMTWREILSDQAIVTRFVFILALIGMLLAIVSSSPVEIHDMGDGVTCYAFDGNIDCLELGK